MNPNEDPSLLAMFNQETKTEPPTQPPVVPTQPPVVPSQPVMMNDPSAMTPVVVGGQPVTAPPITPDPSMGVTTPPTTVLPSFQPRAGGQVINPTMSNEDSDLLSTFMGYKYKEFGNGGFNVGAFFFGPIYFFYRKMILYGFIYYGVYTLLSRFINASIVGVAMEILAALFVNQIYVDYSVKKVEAIKAQHPGATHEELKELCRKKGGTSILLAVGASFVWFALLLVFVILYVILAYAGGKTLQGASIDNNKTIPETFIVEHAPEPFQIETALSEDTSLDFYYYDEGDKKNTKCHASLSSLYYTNMNDALEYYKGYSKNLVIEEKKTDDFVWESIVFDHNELVGVEKTHLYLTEYNGKIYRFQIELREDGPEDCFEQEEAFIQSIKKR
ncbi:MAG: DUF2628 domain-containing protein [Bacilli bacterium]|nr:DUF2628 domain-containing protein [Bacilli bacterium]